MLEQCILVKLKPIFKEAQNSLQRGFTEGVAPMFAALILVEVINEYADNKDDLTVLLLDAEKAFDRVWHEGLFRKLHSLGIPDTLLRVIINWYQNFTCQIKWCNSLSSPFPVRQGTIQGSSLSPELYKVLGNDTLNTITQRHMGALIGTTCCGIATCADDMALAAPSGYFEDSLALQLVEDRVNMDRVTINASKTVGLYYSFSGLDKKPKLLFNNKNVPFEDSGVHLGILQSASVNLNAERVDTKIKEVTRTIYALFGAGMHGRNGLNPVVIRKIWHTYISFLACYMERSYGH